MFSKTHHEHGNRRYAHKLLELGRQAGEHIREHHRRHHSGRGSRMLDHGDLRFLLLHLIADKPAHGYELIKLIEERFGGFYSPSPGVVYPTLTLLEELGYVSATQDGAKKLHTITADGTSYLAANQAQVDAVLAKTAAATQAYGDGPAPELLRAYQNLKVALKLRLRRAPMAPEQARAIADKLDQLARDIERT